VFLLAVGIVAYYLVPALLPRLNSCSGPSYGLLAGSNLKSIALGWIVQRHHNPSLANFDHEQVKPFVGRALSPWMELTAIKLRYTWSSRALSAARTLTPFLIFTLLLTMLCRGRWRRMGKAALFSTLGFMCVCLVMGPATKVVFPTSHAYLEDYVYVKGLNWDIPTSEQGTTVIAYAKQPWHKRRPVAFMDGHIAVLKADEFEALATDQGIDLADAMSEE